jgi:hypothetical protein
MKGETDRQKGADGRSWMKGRMDRQCEVWGVRVEVKGFGHFLFLWQKKRVHNQENVMSITSDHDIYIDINIHNIQL